MKKNEKNLNEDIIKAKKVLIIIFLVILILLMLLIISNKFGDYNNIKLKKNNKTIFSISDLVVDDLKYSDNLKTVKEKMGKPSKEKEEKDGIYTYKVLYYDGIILTLKENYSDYILVKVEIKSKKYVASRKIKIGDSILSVMNKYRIDNEKSTYMYGNYSTKALDNSEIKENIYLGVRSSREIVYINKDAIVDESSSNIARLNINYKHGKVTNIIWSYDLK